MKYVAEFSDFDSALVAQGDLLSLEEDGRLVHGYSGLNWKPAVSPEVLAISQNLSKLSQNDDGTFWATVTLDSETGEVTCSDLYRYCCGGNGYGNAKAVKEVAHA
jgi:hypothetical protein